MSIFSASNLSMPRRVLFFCIAQSKAQAFARAIIQSNLKVSSNLFLLGCGLLRGCLFRRSLFCRGFFRRCFFGGRFGSRFCSGFSGWFCCGFLRGCCRSGFYRGLCSRLAGFASPPTVVAPAACLPTEATPFSLALAVLYISLLPIGSPLAAFITKYGEPLL